MNNVLKLKPDCPLAKLNNFFPAGIPVIGTEPSLVLYDKKCWELNLEGLSKTQLEKIAVVVTEDTVPVSIQMTMITVGTVVIPDEWVCTKSVQKQFI